MRTIGRTVHPPFDTQVPAMCAYCGAMWPRNQLWRDGAGNLVCPNEGSGRDRVTLEKENARLARIPKKKWRLDATSADRSGHARVGDPRYMFGAELHAWFRADNLRFDDTGRVQALWDWSGRAHDLLADAAADRPQQVTLPSRQRAILFAGTEVLEGRVAHDWGLLHRGDVTLSLVADSTSGDAIVSTGATATVPGVSVLMARRAVTLRYTTGSGTVSKVQSTPEGLRRIVVRADADGAELRVNGEASAELTVTIAAPARPPSHALALGGTDATVAELVIVKRRIDDDELASHEAYYATRYG